MSGYYDKQIGGMRLDPYRIATIYGITHPAHFHAMKKILRAGEGAKDLETDIDETIRTLERWKDMIAEDASVSLSDSSANL